MTARIEAESSQPHLLRDKISASVTSRGYFLRAGQEIETPEERGGTVFLEVPTQFALGPEGFPEDLLYNLPPNPQRKSRLILKSRGPLRVAQITVLPKDFETANATLILESTDGESKVSFRRGKFFTPITYQPQISDFFSGLIDRAGPWRKTLPDYLQAIDSWKDESWTPEDIQSLRASMTIAFGELGGIRRRSHEPQTEHVFETARILAEEMGIKNPVILSAAILHDVPEDGQGFRQFNLEDGDPPEVIIRHSMWEAQTIEKLVARSVEREAAQLALGVSRPKAEGIEIPSRAKGYEKYYSRFRDDIRLILIKLADRLHNGRTLWAMPIASQRWTVIESRAIYWQIFELARERFPEAVDYGLSELDSELRERAENPKLKIDYDSI